MTIFKTSPLGKTEVKAAFKVGDGYCYGQRVDDRQWIGSRYFAVVLAGEHNTTARLFTDANINPDQPFTAHVTGSVTASTGEPPNLTPLLPASTDDRIALEPRTMFGRDAYTVANDGTLLAEYHGPDNVAYEVSFNADIVRLFKAMYPQGVFYGDPNATKPTSMWVPETGVNEEGKTVETGKQILVAILMPVRS